MRKITLLVWAGLLCSVYNASSQTKVAEFKHKISDKPYNYFLYRDLEYDTEGKKLAIYGQNWKLATLTVTKEGKSTGFINGNKNIPYVYVAKLDGNGSNEVVEEAINLKSIDRFNMEGKEYEAADPKSKETFSSSADAMYIDELMSKYPKSFPTATKDAAIYQMTVGAQWKGFYVVETLQEYNFKDDESKLIKGESTSKTLKPELGDEYRIYPEKYSMVDNKRRMALVPTLLGVKKDKLAGYKNKRIYTIDKEGKIAHQFDVNLEYPKSLIFATGLGHSATDTVTNFEDGALLIYGRAFGVGKKNNDPDKTRYYVVITDEYGKMVYSNEFKFGSDKRSLTPYYAFKQGEDIHVFAKATGSDNPGYSVLTFNSTGLINTREYNYDAFKSLAVGDDETRLNSNYARNFLPLSHHVLANGDILIHGESYESTTKTEQRELPSGQTSSHSYEVKTFFGNVFLLMGKDGELKAHYTTAKTAADAKKNVTHLKKLKDENNRIYFVGEVKDTKDSHAVIIKLDYGANEISKTSLSDHSVFDLRDAVVTKYNADASQLVVLGRNSDRDTFTVKSVVFELN
ncbi:MAG: hypothetical protein MJA30_32730 [Cytophagales bacterium]|nr:hypothetical protein [Cytophagales bacterium]